MHPSRSVHASEFYPSSARTGAGSASAAAGAGGGSPTTAAPGHSGGSSRGASMSGKREAAPQELLNLAMQSILYVIFTTPDYKIALTGSAALAMYLVGASQQPRDLDFCMEDTSREDHVFHGAPDRLEPTAGPGSTVVVRQPGSATDLIQLDIACRRAYAEKGDVLGIETSGRAALHADIRGTVGAMLVCSFRVGGRHVADISLVNPQSMQDDMLSVFQSRLPLFANERGENVYEGRVVSLPVLRQRMQVVALGLPSIHGMPCFSLENNYPAATQALQRMTWVLFGEAVGLLSPKPQGVDFDPVARYKRALQVYEQVVTYLRQWKATTLAGGGGPPDGASGAPGASATMAPEDHGHLAEAVARMQAQAEQFCRERDEARDSRQAVLRERDEALHCQHVLGQEYERVVAELRAARTDADAARLDLEAVRSQRQEDASSFTQVLQTLEGHAAELQGQVRELQGQLADRDRALASREAAVKEASRAREAAQKHAKASDAQVTQLKQQAASHRASLQAAQKKADEAVRQTTEALRVQSQLEKQVDAAQRDKQEALRVSAAKVEQSKQALASMQQQLSEEQTSSASRISVLVSSMAETQARADLQATRALQAAEEVKLAERRMSELQQWVRKFCLASNSALDTQIEPLRMAVMRELTSMSVQLGRAADVVAAAVQRLNQEVDLDGVEDPKGDDPAWASLSHPMWARYHPAWEEELRAAEARFGSGFAESSSPSRRSDAPRVAVLELMLRAAACMVRARASGQDGGSGGGEDDPTSLGWMQDDSSGTGSGSVAEPAAGPGSGADSAAGAGVLSSDVAALMAMVANSMTPADVETTQAFVHHALCRAVHALEAPTAPRDKCPLTAAEFCREVLVRHVLKPVVTDGHELLRDMRAECFKTAAMLQEMDRSLKTSQTNLLSLLRETKNNLCKASITLPPLCGGDTHGASDSPGSPNDGLLPTPRQDGVQATCAQGAIAMACAQMRGTSSASVVAAFESGPATPKDTGAAKVSAPGGTQPKAVSRMPEEVERVLKLDGLNAKQFTDIYSLVFPYGLDEALISQGDVGGPSDVSEDSPSACTFQIPVPGASPSPARDIGHKDLVSIAPIAATTLVGAGQGSSASVSGGAGTGKSHNGGKAAKRGAAKPDRKGSEEATGPLTRPGMGWASASDEDGEGRKGRAPAGRMVGVVIDEGSDSSVQSRHPSRSDHGEDGDDDDMEDDDCEDAEHGAAGAVDGIKVREKTNPATGLSTITITASHGALFAGSARLTAAAKK